MPSIESIKKDIDVLGVEEQEELLHYLEEIFVLGSFTAEVTSEVKESSFPLLWTGRGIKEWMYKFHGVATKYLSGYMYWFKWLQFFNNEKDTVKSKHLLVQSHTSHCDTGLKDFSTRKPIYI